MKIELRKLPSGFWAVFVNGEWVEASMPDEKSAKEWVAERYGKDV